MQNMSMCDLVILTSHILTIDVDIDSQNDNIIKFNIIGSASAKTTVRFCFLVHNHNQTQKTK